jgi:hypothetical protein
MPYSKGNLGPAYEIKIGDRVKYQDFLGTVSAPPTRAPQPDESHFVWVIWDDEAASSYVDPNDLDILVT